MNILITCSVFILVGWCGLVENASILALFPSLSYSDHLVYRGYLSLLAQRGHSVVVMTPYPGHFRPQEVERIVELSVGQESLPYWEEYTKILTGSDDLYPRMKAINELNVKLTVSQLKSKPMTALFINPNVRFDLIITQAEIPLLYALAEKYDAPHITISASSGTINNYESKGVSVDPILYPDVNTLNYRNLSGYQKLVEIRRHYNTRKEYYGNYIPLCEIAAKKIFDVKTDLLTLEKNIDMLFIANNPALIGNRPTSPAVAYVDRLNLKPGATLLPEDLKRLLDSATQGAIYFSLGAIQESEHLSVDILQTLASAFKELPYTVLWKIGNTTMFNKSENVIANGWFPQQEILAHPNVKVFITHGGSRSLEEAVFYETPIVGLPIVRSRKVFIEEVTRHGAGEVLDLYYLEKDNVKEVLSRVVTNDSYKNAVLKLKQQIFDPIISGPEKAVLWTEYVLRNRGASILQSPVVEPTIAQYLTIEVISLTLVLLILILSLSYFAVKYIVRQIRIFILSRYDLTGKFKAL